MSPNLLRNPLVNLLVRENNAWRGGLLLRFFLTFGEEWAGVRRPFCWFGI